MARRAGAGEGAPRKLDESRIIIFVCPWLPTHPPTHLSLRVRLSAVKHRVALDLQAVALGHGRGADGGLPPAGAAWAGGGAPAGRGAGERHGHFGGCRERRASQQQKRRRRWRWRRRRRRTDEERQRRLRNEIKEQSCSGGEAMYVGWCVRAAGVGFFRATESTTSSVAAGGPARWTLPARSVVGKKSTRPAWPPAVRHPPHRKQCMSGHRKNTPSAWLS